MGQGKVAAAAGVWKREFSAEHAAHYWWHTGTRHTTWNDPTDPPGRMTQVLPAL